MDGPPNKDHHGVVVVTGFRDAAQKKQFRKLFEKGDKNKNGTLDRKELQAVIRAIFKKYDVDFNAEYLKKYTEKKFAAFDKNNDQSLDFEEFVELYRAIITDPDIPTEMRASQVVIEGINFRCVGGKIIQRIDTTNMPQSVFNELLEAIKITNQIPAHPHIQSMYMAGPEPTFPLPIELVFPQTQLHMFFPGQQNIKKSQILHGNALCEPMGRFYGLISAVQHLHDHNCYDLYLSPDNLFSASHNHMKIFNHYLNRLYRHSPDLFTSEELIFVAPDQTRSKQCDIYSIGVFLHYIATKKLPGPAGENDRIAKIAPTLWEKAANDDVQRELVKLIYDCIHEDPSKRPRSAAEILDKLRDITIRAVLFDPLAVNFWKQYYPTVVSCPIDKFSKNFVNHFKFGPDPHLSIKIRAFQFLLRGGTEFCLMQEFSRVLWWFGPLEKENNEILTRLESQLAKRSFHGLMEAPEATTCLQNTPLASYLIRFSGNIPGAYTVSVKVTAGISHFRVYHTMEQKFARQAGGTGEFANLEEYVAEVVRTAKVEIKFPVASKTYDQIFTPYSLENSAYVRPSFYCFDEIK